MLAVSNSNNVYSILNNWCMCINVSCGPCVSCVCVCACVFVHACMRAGVPACVLAQYLASSRVFRRLLISGGASIAHARTAPPREGDRCAWPPGMPLEPKWLYLYLSLFLSLSLSLLYIYIYTHAFTYTYTCMHACINTHLTTHLCISACQFNACDFYRLGKPRGGKWGGAEGGDIWLSLSLSPSLCTYIYIYIEREIYW